VAGWLAKTQKLHFQHYVIKIRNYFYLKEIGAGYQGKRF